MSATQCGGSDSPSRPPAVRSRGRDRGRSAAVGSPPPWRSSTGTGGVAAAVTQGGVRWNAGGSPSWVHHLLPRPRCGRDGGGHVVLRMMITTVAAMRIATATRASRTLAVRRERGVPAARRGGGVGRIDQVAWPRPWRRRRWGDSACREKMGLDRAQPDSWMRSGFGQGSGRRANAVPSPSSWQCDTTQSDAAW